MKLITIALAALLSLCAQAQTNNKTNYGAIGVSTNGSATAGTGMYARLLADSTGTYAFTVMDAVPSSYKPFIVTTSYGAGIAQKLFSIGSTNVFSPNSAGVSFTGSNTGWSWTTGILAAIPIKKSGWYVMPNVRAVKSNVAATDPNATGYQLIGGVMFGWGW